MTAAAPTRPAGRWRRTAGQQGWALPALGALLLLSIALSASGGALDIPVQRIPVLLLGGARSDEERLWAEVLWTVRLPRVLLGVAVGAGLAIAGGVMQALFRNGLAEPGLLGVSMGGAAGAVAAIVLGATGLWAVAPAAFVGSLAATAFAWYAARREHGAAQLLLTGVAVNALCGALVGLFTFHANDVQLRSLTFWNMGSLATAQWPMLAWLMPWVMLLIGWLARQWHVLNMLLLGERESALLGMDLPGVQRRLIVGVAMLVGPLVAVTGTIAFVGLLVPHLVRLVLGGDHRTLLPCAALAGASIMVLADGAARVLVVPAELPIGVVTALIGAPFLLWLLRR